MFNHLMLIMRINSVFSSVKENNHDVMGKMVLP